MFKDQLKEQNVGYEDKLLQNARRRFIDKTELTGGKDPYEMSTNE